MKFKYLLHEECYNLLIIKILIVYLHLQIIIEFLLINEVYISEYFIIFLKYLQFIFTYKPIFFIKSVSLNI